MQRKLGKKNVILFTLFTVIVITIIAVFSFFLIKVLGHEEEEYHVGKGSIIYDIENSFIALTDDAKINKNWNDEYYLYLNNKEKYELGKNTVLYDASDYKVYLYGTAYQVYNTGKVEIKSGVTEIIRIGESTFYKLSDRKYLIVSKDITSTIGNFKSSNYLVVEIDKSGNALLMNNEVYVKTINPMILSTSSFDFDVANEKLIIGKSEINLKKVIGSTNQYVKVETKKENSEGTTNNTNNITNISGSGGIVYGPSTQKEIKIVKYIGVNSITPDITYIDYNYKVVDVKDEFASVFLLVDGEEFEEAKKYYLSKQTNSYKITGLLPNHQYTLTFGYTYIDSSSGTNTVIERVEDVSIVTTSKPNNKLIVEKVTQDGVYLNLKIDDKYVYGALNASLYINDTLTTTVEVNIDEAKKSEGWSFNFDIPSNERKITVKLEDAYYNGELTDIDVAVSYINE